MYQYRALLDADEVLVDFQAPALKVMGAVTGRVWTAHDIDMWDIFGVLTEEQRVEVFKIIKAPGFCASLEPLPGAIEAVAELRQTFSDVHVVTSPFYGAPTWVQERMDWLNAKFGFTEEDVTHTRAKWGVYGNALLDDKPAMPERWAACHPGGLALLYHTPNTRNIATTPDVRRVYSYAEAIRLMKDHAERRQGVCTRCAKGT